MKQLGRDIARSTSHLSHFTSLSSGLPLAWFRFAVNCETLKPVTVGWDCVGAQGGIRTRRALDRSLRVSHGWQPCILSAGSRKPRTGLYYLNASGFDGRGASPNTHFLGSHATRKRASL